MPEEFEVVVAENRRLLGEIRELRARVAALESSRWWRAHPRLAVRRLRRREAPAEPTPAPEPAVTAGDDQLIARFHREILDRGSFHDDEFSVNIPSWEPVMRELDGRGARLLEIGSFEGMSAAFLLWRLPDARITCIDTFAGGPSFAVRGADVSGLEATFDRNLRLVGDRVRKLVGDSGHVLRELLETGERFDLVFVDGSDLALDVLVDACLSWQLLAPGGFMIFDNYRWRSPLGEDRLLQPAPAIDAFLDLVSDHCELVRKEKQAIVRRLAD
jgi:predicted O-methyltransferase YrrM